MKQVKRKGSCKQSVSQLRRLARANKFRNNGRSKIPQSAEKDSGT